MPGRHIRSAPKSRTGCMTCKYRHVKCDEAVPYCHRCLRSGFHCLGYEQRRAPYQGSKPATNATMEKAQMAPRLPLHLTELTVSEDGRALHYFRNKTLPILNRYWDNEARCSHLLATAASSPVVHHAILATSYGHEMAETSQTHGVADANALSTKAMLHYGKAIHLFCALIKAGGSPLGSMQAVPVLFALHEFLMGRDQEMMLHLQNGMNLLESCRKSGLSSDDDAYFEGLFVRLRLISSTYGRPRQSYRSEIPQVNHRLCVPSHFADLDEARRTAALLQIAVLRFIRVAEAGTFPSALIVQQIQCALAQQLGEWRDTFDAFCAQTPQNDGESRGRSIMRAQYHLAHIFLHCGTSQMAFDQHLVTFETILNMIDHATLRDASDAPRASFEFVFDVGIIPVLFFTATRCRHPITRRRAVTLLRNIPCREMLWDAVEAADVADVVIRYEEEHGYRSEERGLIFVPESARVQDIDIQGTDRNSVGPRLVLLSLKPMGPSGHESRVVTLYV